MPTHNALQHIFSSVDRGYFAQQGRGFQTVAVAEELVGTEDLRALEDAAFYAVSRERRRVRDFPVKQAFFRLPSGRFAIGRTVDWGTDSLGREGNYLAHHLVLSRDELLAAGANPFAILDAAQLAEKTAEGGMDLTPRALPPLAIEVAPAEAAFHSFDGIGPELLASLAAPAVDGGERTALLIGDETRAEGVLRGLFAALATEERLRLTFSTHFHESHHLRSLFALATVRSRAEAPSQRESYAVFDLDDGEFPRVSPTSAYADWLAGSLRSRRWEEIVALNDALDGLRDGKEIRKGSLPTNAKACAALWERAEMAVVRALAGEARLMVEFLRQLPSPQSLADVLLDDEIAPSELCGVDASPVAVNDCLLALRSAATRKVWRAWVKRWSDDPALASLTRDAQPWWQRWKRPGANR